MRIEDYNYQVYDINKIRCDSYFALYVDIYNNLFIIQRIIYILEITRAIINIIVIIYSFIFAV